MILRSFRMLKRLCFIVFFSLIMWGGIELFIRKNVSVSVIVPVYNSEKFLRNSWIWRMIILLKQKVLLLSRI